MPCPPPGDLPDTRIKPTSLMFPALPCRFYTTSATWEAQISLHVSSYQLIELEKAESRTGFPFWLHKSDFTRIAENLTPYKNEELHACITVKIFRAHNLKITINLEIIRKKV